MASPRDRIVASTRTIRVREDAQPAAVLQHEMEPKIRARLSLNW
jgi:hypothetical protein